MRYFFVLGRTPDLSVLEILNIAKRLRIDFINVSLVSRSVLLVNAEKEIDIKKIMKELGGVIKAGRIVDIQQIKADLIADFLEKNINKEKKFYFGFSVYGQHLNKKTFKHKNRPSTEFGPGKLKNLGLEIKKLLKKRGVKSRFVISREDTLSSVIVKTNKLVSDQGKEIVFVYDMIHDAYNMKHITDGDILVGETLAVQEFESFSWRDYGRPRRDMKIGMLPPKLARMMINVSGVDNDKVILDPFCGGGTVLQELLLLGYKNIIGSDISKEMIEDTKANLKWLRAKYNYKNIFIKEVESHQGRVMSHKDDASHEGRVKSHEDETDPHSSSLMTNDYKLYNEDVTKLSNVLPKNSIDAIVTEPHMGPVLTGRESKEKLAYIMEDLSKLYIRAFLEFKKILKNNGIVVMVWPVFNAITKVPFDSPQPCSGRVTQGRQNTTKTQFAKDNKFTRIDILDEIKKMGFKSVLGADTAGLVNISGRDSVLYMRDEQRIGREVHKFRVSR